MPPAVLEPASECKSSLLNLLLLVYAATACNCTGSANGVVLWDVRTQEAVGSIPAVGGAAAAQFGAACSPGKRSSTSSSSPHLSCVGVQLDDWRVVTGFSAAGSSGGGGSGNGVGPGIGAGCSSSSSTACWWHSSGDAWNEEASWHGQGSGHSLEVYDIRSAASWSSAAAANGNGSAASVSSSSVGRSGMWSAPAVMSLPVPSRVTCFQVRASQCAHALGRTADHLACRVDRWGTSLELPGCWGLYNACLCMPSPPQPCVSCST